MGLKYTVRHPISRFLTNFYGVKLGSLKSLVTFGNTADSEMGKEEISFSVNFLRYLTELVLSTEQCPWRPVSSGGLTGGTLKS